MTVSVFTPSRPDLIRRTFEAIEGLPKVLVHMYLATVPTWRDVVRRTLRDLFRATCPEPGTEGGTVLGAFTTEEVSSGPDSPAPAYAHCRVDGTERWGVGRDTSVLTASLRAVLCAVDRAG